MNYEIESVSLAFLYEHALARQRVLSDDEQKILKRITMLVERADEVVVSLGGKAGRLGECIVGTALLDATLQALVVKGKIGTPVSIVVDEGVVVLFNEELYQEYYWPQIRVVSSTQYDLDVQKRHGKHVVSLDFHGGHDALPTLQIEDRDGTASYTQLTCLFRVGVRSYAQRGPLRRYADFIEELCTLPAGSIDGKCAQPMILLSAEDETHYLSLSKELDLDASSLQTVCFFQSVVLAKCYERWDEVLLLFCEYLAQHFPQQKVTFLIACGPDADLPEGFKRVDIEEWLQDFTGVNNNAHVRICSIPSLRDLASVIKHATLVLANDTGPGHMAGALAIPTVTPYLPGNIYSKQVWASTLWHHGVTLEQHNLTFRELEAAVVWGKTDIINLISPEDLLHALYDCLPAELHIPHKRGGINLSTGSIAAESQR